MPLSKYVCFILLLLPFIGNSQGRIQVLTDSIRIAMSGPDPDSSSLHVLLNLVQVPGTSPDTLLKYGKQWYAYTERTATVNGKPEALYVIGLALYRKGLNSKAAEYLYKAAAIWDRDGSNPLQLARTFELIAGIQKTMQQYETALKFYRRSMAIKSKLRSPSILLSTYNGLGNTFRLVKQIDSAIFYLKKAYMLSGDNDLAQAQVSNNLGNIYWSEKDWQTAAGWYNKALNSFIKLNQEEGISEVSFNLGTIATQQKQYKKAISYYQRCLKNLPQNLSLEHIEWVYEHLADAYYHTGNFNKAYINEVAYLKVKDSTLPLKVQQSIADLQEKYETEKKEHALALEQEKTARLQATNSYQLRLLFLLSGIVLLVGGMGGVIIWNVRRKQILANELKDKEQALKTNIAMLAGREQERNRIARDLHDRLGGTLCSVQLCVDSMNDSPPVKEKINMLLDTAINDVRRISHDLSDNILLKYGLEAGLKDIRESIEMTGQLKVTLYLQGLEKLPMHVSVEIYYIIRELATNAIRHSEASQLFIQVRGEKNELVLTVEDNGKGFDPVAMNKGMGLANIETRVRKLKGDYTIDTVKGNGSCFYFSIPLL
ncbi:tetratricopeptide repeat protein [Chitinophaga sp.]|uniref:tetratricopeptide repeat-containing sensor histidine kinase n=1 Tax=Chitinophaga sp. TaxID=1869181 RepID=UPI0031D2AE34